MDRPWISIVTRCGLMSGLILAGSGCRNLRSPEIPPEPPYYSSGAANPPTVGFSSEPASVNPYSGALPGTSPDATSPGLGPAYAGQPGASPYGGNYGMSAYTPTVGDPAVAPAALPEPDPLQGIPGTGAAVGGNPIAGPGGF